MKQTLGAFLVHSDHIYVETVTLILLEGTHIIVLLASIALCCCKRAHAWPM